jgi:hypothetical protein
VVEVALFPPKGTNFEVDRGQFSLRLNGKHVLAAADPNLVIEDMKHPEFRPAGPHSEEAAGVNDHTVILGAPRINPDPFPGSPIPRTPTVYPPVEIPRDNPSGVTKEPTDPYTLLLETTLEEGQHHAAISGFLYFPFRGKTKSIKSVELVYQDVVLKLQ